MGEVPILEGISSSCDIGEPISHKDEAVFLSVFDKISQNFLESVSKIKNKTVKIES